MRVRHLSFRAHKPAAAHRNNRTITLSQSGEIHYKIRNRLLALLPPPVAAHEPLETNPAPVLSVKTRLNAACAAEYT